MNIYLFIYLGVPYCLLKKAYKFPHQRYCTFCSSGPMKMSEILLNLSAAFSGLANMLQAKCQTHIFGFLFSCRSWPNNSTFSFYLFDTLKSMIFIFCPDILVLFCKKVDPNYPVCHPQLEGSPQIFFVLVSSRFFNFSLFPFPSFKFYLFCTKLPNIICFFFPVCFNFF